MGNGLRRLYRLPKLTTAPSKATGVSAIAAAPEPVAEPVKKGLFAMFGR